MQCHEFDERMHLLLDERRAPQADVLLQAHARGCDPCRQTLEIQQSLFRGLAQASSPRVSSSFSARVLHDVDFSRPAMNPTSARRPWMLALAVLSSAAAALIGLTIALNRQGANPGHSPPASSQVGSKPLQSAVASSDRETSRSPVHNTIKSAVFAPPPDGRSLEEYRQALQSLAAQVPQAVEQFDEDATPGLRSVRTSFSLAIGTIRRTIPAQRKSPPPKPAKRDSGWLVAPAAQPV